MIVNLSKPKYKKSNQYIPIRATRGRGGLIVACHHDARPNTCERCIFKNCCQFYTGIKDIDIEGLRALGKLFKKMKELMERRLAWKRN